MANDLMKDPAYLELLSLAGMSGGFDEAVGGSSRSRPPYVSLESNRFTLIRDGIEVPAPNPVELHFVVVGQKRPMSRAYYLTGEYDPANPSPPECWSVDGWKPEEGSNPPPVAGRDGSIEEGTVASNCAECSMAVWGSAVSKRTGEKVPACKTHKQMVIKVMGVEGSWIFSLPPKSISGDGASLGWNGLVEQLRKSSIDLKAKSGKDTISMFTTVIRATFTRGFMGVLDFAPIGWLKGEETHEVLGLVKDSEASAVMLWGSLDRKAAWEEKYAPRKMLSNYGSNPLTKISNADVTKMIPPRESLERDMTFNQSPSEKNEPDIPMASPVEKKKQARKAPPSNTSSHPPIESNEMDRKKADTFISSVGDILGGLGID